MKNEISLEKIFNSNNIKNDTIVIPKEVVVLDSVIGNKIKELKIKKITFEEGSLLEEISKNAFLNNEILEIVDLDNCEKIERFCAKCFLGCKNLREVNLSQKANITEIQIYAFSETAIESMDFSNMDLQIIGAESFASCSKLKVLKFCNCSKLDYISKDFIKMTHLNLLDFSGSNHIDFIQNNNINAKLIKLSADMSGVDSPIFYSTFEDNCIIQAVRNNKIIAQFDKDSEEIQKIKVVALKRYLYCRKFGEVDSSLINNVYTRKGLDIAYTNKEDLEVIFKDLEEKGCKKDEIYTFLNKMGYFDTFTKDNYELLCKKDGCASFSYIPQYTQNDYNSYKELLAKEYVKARLDTYVDKDLNKKEIDIIIQSQSNKLARQKSMNELVSDFIKNKILLHKDCKKLIDELNMGDNKYHVDINFNKFFVFNFDEIMEKKISILDDNIIYNENYTYHPDGKVRLYEIYNDFLDIQKKYEQKSIITNKANIDDRLKLDDCEKPFEYQNINEEDEELAKLCGEAHIKERDFIKYKYSELNHIALSMVDKQILKVKDDKIINNKISYEFIKKDNPKGFIIGFITNCCQRLDSTAASCVANGMTDPNSGFVTFIQNGMIIGQSWVWYNEIDKVLAFDNIEIINKLKDNINRHNLIDFNDCLVRLSKNFISTMKENGKEIENIVVGAKCTDVHLSEIYRLEENPEKMFYCDKEYNGEKCYSDINEEGQYIIIKDGKLQKKEAILHNNDIIKK